jgi:hypothetical protein
MPPPVVVTGRHRPHEVALLAFSVVLGLAFVVGAKPPGSIESLMPGWFRWGWYVLLLASGVAGLAGFFAIRDVYSALTLERAAMWGQAAAFAIYALAILVLGGWRGVAAGGLCVALAVASVWRLRQVGREIDAVRAAAEGST